MRKVTLIAGLILLAIVLLVASVPKLRYSAMGSVNKEPRIDGMPAGYWMYTVRQPGDADDRIVAINNLTELGAAVPGTLDTLRSASADPEPRVRAAAVTALGRLATVEQVAEDLVKLLADPDGAVRASTASAIGQLRPAGQPVLDALLKQAKNDGSVPAKVAAIGALGQYGVAAFDAAPSLIESLLETDTPNGSPHIAAVSALSRICINHAPLLTASLSRAEVRVRLGLLKSLAEIGPPAITAIPVVAKMTTDSDPIVRLESAQTLWKIERKPEVPLAIARTHLSLVQPDRMIRIGTKTKALYLLGEMGSAGMSAVPDMIQILKAEPESAIRMYTAMALGKIGRTPEIMNALETCSKTDGDPDVCWAANETMKLYKGK